MKKTLLFVSVMALGTSFAQNCSDLFISEYVEGTGNDKALELYNPTSATINLTGYRIERFSNGQATSASGGILSLTGSVAPYSTFVITNGQTSTSPSSPACSPALQAMADQLDGVYPAPTYMNGNDAIVLFKNAVIIDIFAKTGDASISTSESWSDEFPYDGSVGAWWTKDQTLVRKATVMTGVSVNPDPFIVTVEWDSLPKDTWTGLGSHTCDCFLGVNELNSNVSFVVYPNPTNEGQFAVNASENIEQVEVINMVGQVVLSQTNTVLSKKIQLDSSKLNNGMYAVKIRFSNNSISQTSLIIE
ncbi:MAG: hypothetical protein RL265_815 [Bacteroidota bacterium]|jgi:hypothetical protein